MAENIGDYTRLIEIWKPSGNLDAANEPDGVFVLHKSKWSKPLAPNGMKTIRSMMDSANITSPVDMRSYRIFYDESITDDMQIRFRGQIMGILLVRHDEQNREWTDLVTKVGASNA